MPQSDSPDRLATDNGPCEIASQRWPARDFPQIVRPLR